MQTCGGDAYPQVQPIHDFGRAKPSYLVERCFLGMFDACEQQDRLAAFGIPQIRRRLRGEDGVGQPVVSDVRNRQLDLHPVPKVGVVQDGARDRGGMIRAEVEREAGRPLRRGGGIFRQVIPQKCRADGANQVRDVHDAAFRSGFST